MLFLGALVIFDIGSSLLGIFQVDKLRGHYKGIQGRGGSVVGISDPVHLLKPTWRTMIYKQSLIFLKGSGAYKRKSHTDFLIRYD